MIKNNWDYCGNKVLDAIDYAENYNNSIVEKIDRLIDNKNIKIMDFGAGKGTLARKVMKLSNKNVCCVEVAENQRKYLTDIETYASLEEVKNEEFDLIYSSNVLEHIENDEKTLGELYQKLKKRGKIFIYVPSGKILYNQTDKELGHFRRYSKDELIKKVKSQGFKVLECEYADSLGFFAALMINILRINNFLNKRNVKLYDKFLFPISKFLDKYGMKYCIGKNLWIIGEK